MPCEDRTSVGEIAMEPLSCGLPQGDNALLVALAVPHVERLLSEIGIGDVDLFQFSHADGGRIEHFEERPITNPEGARVNHSGKTMRRGNPCLR